MFNLFKKQPPKSITIIGTEEQLTINGVPVTFPTNHAKLVELFGEPSRSSKTKLTKSTLLCWDAEGVYCNYASSSHIYSFSLIFSKKHQLELSPKNNFSGSININNKDILFDDFDGIKFDNYVLRKLIYKGEEQPYAIAFMVNLDVKKEIATDTYQLKPTNEELLEFSDFGFKLAVIQELMYIQEVLQPLFDVNEFANWYTKRKIDIDQEGYEPIAEVTQYFKDFPVPKRLAPLVTKIYQDGGNDIYLNLLPHGNGSEEYWDIKSCADAKHFPNLKKVTLCYAADTIIDELNHMGIESEWL
ncbi:DUF6892 domain-containing protein [Maribacter hydrothermalis]|uniref:Uncharacterized protein n=1 Tax=Maribacter hydrothermalis TaxID=1836467 RepID=A0A1B7ZDZ2_9FLAO|nr:hypothetical protein [Maribacter hydrothermalis]APQ16582.1 hypothetical protein BTR34_04200 [Maribacter hydrothermalis]OBR41513.1 hypothetical protein A9200_12835 [Maribacter hydrothermalis]